MQKRLKHFLLIKDGINEFGYVPLGCGAGERHSGYGLATNGSGRYCYVAFNSHTELIRYDGRQKRWAVLKFAAAKKQTGGV